MNCPRCSTTNGEAALRCAGCGAPIAFDDGGPMLPVTAPVFLDRRSRPRSSPSALELPVEIQAERSGVFRPEPMDEPTTEPLPAGTEEWSLGEVPGGAMDLADGPGSGAVAREFQEPVARLEEPIVEIEEPIVRVEEPILTVEEPAVDLVDPADEPTGERPPAWRRIAAWVADGAALATLLTVLLLPTLGPLDDAGGLGALRSVIVPVFLVVALLGFAWQWLGLTLLGATPGALLAGIQVVGPDGQRPSPGRAAIRSLLGLLAVAPAGVGLLPVLFTRSGRGAHDNLARTWVVLARG